MTEPEIEFLLWDELDGELTDPARARLEAALAVDPAARELRERLRSMNALLAEVEEASPPAELRPRLRQAIAGRQRPAPAPTPAPRTFDWRALWAPPRLRFAYLAAGLLIGAVGALLVAGGVEPAPDAMVGTINVPPETIARPADGLSLPLPEGQGDLTVWIGGSEIRAELELAAGAADGVEWRLDHGGGLRLEALDASGTRVERLTVGPDSIVLAQAGRGRLSMTLAASGRGEAAVDLRLSAAGGVLLETRFTAGEEPAR